MDLNDSVIIVTGATSGIGLATVRLLSQRGAQVVGVARNTADLVEPGTTVNGVFTIQADVTDEDAMHAMIKKVHARFGRVDVLINNAGQGYEGSLEFVDESKLLYLFRLHVLGPLAAMQAVIPIMRRQGGGRIINVSSPTAKLILPRLGAYSATKAALRCMTLTARKELAKDRIVVSVFYPFITASNFGNNVFHTDEERPLSDQGMTLPDPDSTEQTAARLVAALSSDKPEVTARGLVYFISGVVKKKLSGEAA